MAQLITTLSDSLDNREKAIKASKLAKKKFKGLIPYRIDEKTVIMIDSRKDILEQINRFTNKLEQDRKNCY